jgi:hypothetical protein
MNRTQLMKEFNESHQWEAWDDAAELAEALGTTAKLWMNLPASDLKNTELRWLETTIKESPGTAGPKDPGVPGE